MAELVFKNAFFNIGTSGAAIASGTCTSLRMAVRSITLNSKVDILDKTAMGSSGRRRIAGLKDATLSVEFNAQYTTQMPVDKMMSLYLGNSSTGVWTEIRPTTAARGTANPAYTGRWVMESYNPVSGGVADLGVMTASFSADGVITRRVA